MKNTKKTDFKMKSTKGTDLKMKNFNISGTVPLSLVQSTAAKIPFFNSFEASAYSGFAVLQWPHQGAKNITSAAGSPFKVSWKFDCLSNLILCPAGQLENKTFFSAKIIQTRVGLAKT